jgi:glycosyltransferase 2 family protein
MTIPKWLTRVGQIVLIAAVTYGIVRALAPELSKITAADLRQWQPNLMMLLLAMLMLFAIFVIHGWLWNEIAARLGGVKLGFKSMLRVYFVSSLGRYIPGKIWQIAGLAMLAQRAGMSAVAATGAMLVGQFGFLTTGLIYLSLILPDWGGQGPVLAAIVLTVLGAGFFFVITSTRIGHDLRAALSRRFGQRFGNALMLLDNVQWKDAAWWFGLYVVTWALIGVAFVVFVSAFVPLTASQQLHVAGTIAAAYLFGYVALFSPAGLGIREAVMVGLLTQVMPASAALVISVGSRLWFTAGELLPLALIPISSDGAHSSSMSTGDSRTP